MRTARTALLGVALVACGSSGRPAVSSVAASSAAASATDEWASSSWEDRHDTMTFSVLPDLGRTFQRFHGTASPTLRCQSCHGETAEAVSYKMPNGLFPLDPAHLPRVDDPDPAKARVAKFMIEVVTPETADLLGVPLHDAATGRGFGCFDCHAKVSSSR